QSFSAGPGAGSGSQVLDDDQSIEDRPGTGLGTDRFRDISPGQVGMLLQLAQQGVQLRQILADGGVCIELQPYGQVVDEQADDAFDARYVCRSPADCCTECDVLALQPAREPYGPGKVNRCGKRQAAPAAKGYQRARCLPRQGQFGACVARGGLLCGRIQATSGGQPAQHVGKIVLAGCAVGLREPSDIAAIWRRSIQQGGATAADRLVNRAYLALQPAQAPPIHQQMVKAGYQIQVVFGDLNAMQPEQRRGRHIEALRAIGCQEGVQSCGIEGRPAVKFKRQGRGAVHDLQRT